LPQTFLSIAAMPSDRKDYNWSIWTSSAAHQYIRPTLFSWIADLKPTSILDIGAGNGHLTAEIAQKFGVRTMGLEGSASGVASAAEQYPQLELAQADVDDPLPDSLRGQFDLVLSIEVIEHLLYPANLLQRAREALKPGGKLILTTPFHGYWKNLAIALCNGFDKHFEPTRAGGHIKFFSRASITALLEEEGFHPERFTTLGRIPPFGCSLIIQAS
jgi:2-polyprenyl-3-methyl-5-hydroxy-6-metoxy-1,4-benzoquinol methylase